MTERKLTDIQKVNVFKIFGILNLVSDEDPCIELLGRLLALKKAGNIEHVDYIRNILRSDDVRRNTIEDFHIVLPRQHIELTSPYIDDILIRIDEDQLKRILVAVFSMADDEIADVYEYAIRLFPRNDESLPGSVDGLAIPFNSETGRLLEFIRYGALSKVR